MRHLWARVGGRVSDPRVSDPRVLDIRHEDDGSVTIDGGSRQVDFRSLESGVYSLLIDGASYEVVVRPEGKGNLPKGKKFLVDIAGRSIPVQLEDPSQAEAGLPAEAEGEGLVTSPMPGRVVNIKVAVGEEVKAGTGVVVVEAMKMENELVTEKSGRVKEIKVKVGETVEGGQELVVIE